MDKENERDAALFPEANVQREKFSGQKSRGKKCSLGWMPDFAVFEINLLRKRKL